MSRRTLLLVLLSAWMSGAQGADDTGESWDLRRDRDGIQVYSRDVEGSPHKEIRSETIVEGVRLSALVAVIEDAESCPQWADRCAESYVVERISPVESLIYSHNDLPFPVSDRDVVARAIWSQDPITKAVTMTSVAVPGVVEKRRGRVRLSDARVRWEFNPLPDGRVQIVNLAHIDPGSPLPAWVTNMLVVDTPFETIAGLIDVVQQPRYRDAVLDFVEEPLSTSR